MTAERVATQIGAVLLDEGFEGLEQVVHDSVDVFRVIIQVQGEWYSVVVKEESL